MTTGFVQAYARLVSQEHEDSDATDSLASWNKNHPVVPSDDDDNFSLTSCEGEDEDGCPKKKKGKSYRSLNWKFWHHGNREYLYSQEDVEEALWELASEEFGGKKANGVFFCLKGAT